MTALHQRMRDDLQLRWRPCRVRLISRYLSQAAGVLRSRRLSPIESGFQNLIQPCQPACKHTRLDLNHDHRLCQPLTLHEVAATVGRGRAALLAASIHDWSVRPPLPVYTAATTSLSHCRWSPRALAMAGASSRVAGQSYGNQWC
jgi:hypothetical protein